MNPDEPRPESGDELPDRHRLIEPAGDAADSVRRPTDDSGPGELRGGVGSAAGEPATGAADPPDAVPLEVGESPGAAEPDRGNGAEAAATDDFQTPNVDAEATDVATGELVNAPTARRGERVRALAAQGGVLLQRATSSRRVDLLAERSRKLWKSPIRGPWLTSVFASMLLVGIPIMFITGLVSYAAYDPRLSGNDNTPGKGILGFYLFNWITSPSWIYRISQGIHVTLGLALTPILLAKLWSVIPKLFEFPPVRSIAHALERASLILIVGGAGLEFATGLADVQYFYPWKFDFYDVHFFGAWMFIAGFVVHVTIKLPTMISALKSRSLRRELSTPLAETFPEVEGDLVAFEPAPPTISRRGVLALVVGSSLTVFVTTAGETIRLLHPLALLAPRGRHLGRDPNDFEVNITFKTARIDPEKTGDSWRLHLEGPQTIELSRAQLLAMPQTTAELPIACVEGWSTVQTWTGVRIADLARFVSARMGSPLYVESLEPPGSPYRSTTLGGNQAFDENALLALKVNGADLAPDHGFPARIIVPGAPGVHCTKWVQQMKFLET